LVKSLRQAQQIAPCKQARGRPDAEKCLKAGRRRPTGKVESGWPSQTSRFDPFADRGSANLVFRFFVSLRRFGWLTLGPPQASGMGSARQSTRGIDLCQRCRAVIGDNAELNLFNTSTRFAESYRHYFVGRIRESGWSF
jgi:hypothetical protein